MNLTQQAAVFGRMKQLQTDGDLYVPIYETADEKTSARRFRVKSLFKSNAGHYCVTGVVDLVDDAGNPSLDADGEQLKMYRTLRIDRIALSIPNGDAKFFCLERNLAPKHRK
jgi:hypothetical protein